MKKLLVFVSIVSLFAFAGSVWASDAVLHDGVGHDGVGHGTSGSTVAERTTAATTLLNNQKSTFATAAKTIDSTMQGYIKNIASDLSDTSTTRYVVSGDEIAEMDSTVLAALASIIGNMPAGSKGYAVPQVKVDSSKVSAGHVIDVVMPTGINLASPITGLQFYANPSSSSSGTAGMWFVYKASDSDTWHKLAYNSGTSAINALAGNYKALVLEIKYADASPYVATSATNTINSGIGATATSGAPSSGSGGGCALGTSALALAVLGLFIAKRRG